MTTTNPNLVIPKEPDIPISVAMRTVLASRDLLCRENTAVNSAFRDFLDVLAREGVISSTERSELSDASVVLAVANAWRKRSTQVLTRAIGVELKTTALDEPSSLQLEDSK